MELMAAKDMPAGYRTVPDPNEVAQVVLGKSTWSVLALTCHIEIFTQIHYKKSIENAEDISDLWKDVFLYHWKEECQHAIIDELEWAREDAKLTEEERDQAVTDLIDLVVAVDGILQVQAEAESDYFLSVNGSDFDDVEQQSIRDGILQAYRWQYIVSGIQEGRFMSVLTGFITKEQGERIVTALSPLM